jgi:hypothetical protein
VGTSLLATCQGSGLIALRLGSTDATAAGSCAFYAFQQWQTVPDVRHQRLASIFAILETFLIMEGGNVHSEVNLQVQAWPQCASFQNGRTTSAVMKGLDSRRPPISFSFDRSPWHRFIYFSLPPGPFSTRGQGHRFPFLSPFTASSSHLEYCVQPLYVLALSMLTYSYIDWPRQSIQMQSSLNLSLSSLFPTCLPVESVLRPTAT